MDSFFATVTWLGSLVFLFPLSALLCAIFFSLQKGTEGLFILLLLLGTSAITHFLKASLTQDMVEQDRYLVLRNMASVFPPNMQRVWLNRWNVLQTSFSGANELCGTLPIKPQALTVILLCETSLTTHVKIISTLQVRETCTCPTFFLNELVEPWQEM